MKVQYAHPNLTDKEVRLAFRKIRRELREAAQAWDQVRMGSLGIAKMTDVYAALERCQHAAFDAKELFGFTTISE